MFCFIGSFSGIDGVHFNSLIICNLSYFYWTRDHSVSTPAAVLAAYSASPSDTAHSHGLASSGTRVDRTPGRTNVALESVKSNGKTRGLCHESRGQYHSNTVTSGSVLTAANEPTLVEGCIYS